MSGNELEPLHQIKENEVLGPVKSNVESPKEEPRQRNSSVKSRDSSVSPLIRAIRSGSSSTSLFLEKTNFDDLDIKEIDIFQRNVFHYAVSKPVVLRKLLKHLETKAAVQEVLNQEDSEGETPIHRAAVTGSLDKAAVQEALNQADSEGETPMHRAAVTGSLESLEILFEYDKSLMKLKTSTGKRSVLHMAVRSQSVVAVKFVLHKVPELANCVDSMLQTPVHYAASQKQTSILQFLISKGCNTTEMDANDQLPIHIAAYKGLRNTVELLLREDPDVVDAVDNADQSPLLLASKHGFFNVASFLLLKNADYKLKDKFGFTAFDWARGRSLPDVVQVFLERNEWKEIVNASCTDPERCLAEMITNMPEMAKMLLDKCVTTKGTNDHPASYQVVYDFFCLESIDDKSSCPQFEALNVMVKEKSETCLRHPVAVKYVDVKWKKRGFKYTIALILFTLICHICLMVYTTNVIGVVTGRQHYRRNVTMRRHGRKPNAGEIMALRVIILIIVSASILKNIIEIAIQRFHYFTDSYHYYRVAFYVSVMSYLLPVNEAITAEQLGYGAVTVMLSWVNLIQFLKVVPVLGIYIILVEKVFWTLMKILTVVLIYLLSFATTFYVLLAEHDSFRNIYISFVSTFVAMVDGIDYDNLFVAAGWYPKIYELKMVILLLFVITMPIVVNNALIGLAVGDANEVMKSARFDRFLRRAKFVIQLEKSLNKIPYLKSREDDCVVEFPLRKKNVFHKISDLFYFGGAVDSVDGASEENEHEHEMEICLEDQIEKAFELKLDHFHSRLQHELKSVQDQIKEDLDEKLGKILEKLERKEK